jgi:phosphonatase-like hydrolase
VSAYELIALDMAGTTVTDDGVVLEAARRTFGELGLGADGAKRAEEYVVATMGQSKIEVFTALVAERAAEANEAFERHYLDAAREIGVSEVPGARATVEALRALGYLVALTTGFSPVTRESLIATLGWAELFDCRVSPADAGRGRPSPDMLWTCALRLRVSAASAVVAVGDTASDMQAGRRAAAGLSVGVLTGTDDEARLRAHGADEVVASVVDLLGLESLNFH